ncbi:hypothetical protein [Noviherbaspirillum pedocola]|uniref:Uncharacterized protein n=1 Tax=Noviherbaspirillum pedocola TaxID=2801341 RepID=A0A934SUW5_9BURK|nr:hypothetical protein [Noviherbaspirillum pedocola]MBK4735875.1 hypothetical protein [Noviherbaspirillum pedocola]
MKPSFFLEFEFLSLVVVSFVLPMAILIGLSLTRRIARISVLLFGVLLIVLSGIDFVLLQKIAASASHTRELLRDPVLGPALSVAVYILPVVFAGIGTNIVSHVVIEHLTRAEKEFDRKGVDS